VRSAGLLSAAEVQRIAQENLPDRGQILPFRAEDREVRRTGELFEWPAVLRHTTEDQAREAETGVPVPPPWIAERLAQMEAAGTLPTEEQLRQAFAKMVEELGLREPTPEESLERRVRELAAELPEPPLKLLKDEE
jgi:hypothetical protein